VCAAISQVPFLDMRQAYSPSPQVTEEMQAAAAEGRYLPAVGQPHEAAFINAPGAEAGWRRVVAIGEESRWRNRVSAAWLMESPYRTSHHAATLHCPWLVCVAADDQVASPGPAIEAACRAPKGEFCIYPDVGHFEIYDGPPHEEVVADELAFLYRHLFDRSLVGVPIAGSVSPRVHLPMKGEPTMSKEQENKTIVTRWFTEYWGKGNPEIVDELGADNLVFSYPLHGELHGREPVKKNITDLVEAFPDMSFDVVGDLVADGDYVVGRWEGGGTHTGAAISDLPVGSLPDNTGKRIHFSGTTVYRIENGKVAEEIGQEQALNVLQQLGLVTPAE
jgi:predicted ester cyclase